MMNENKDEHRPAPLVITVDSPVAEETPTPGWGGFFLAPFQYMTRATPVAVPPPDMAMESPATFHVEPTIEEPHPAQHITPVTSPLSPARVPDEFTLGPSLETVQKQLEEQRQIIAEGKEREEQLRQQLQVVTEAYQNQEREAREVLLMTERLLNQQAAERLRAANEKKQRAAEEAAEVIAQAKRDRVMAEVREAEAKQEAVRLAQEMNAWKRMYAQEEQERQLAAEAKAAQELREAEAREAARRLLEDQERQRATEAREAFARTCSTGAPTLEGHYKALDGAVKKAGL